jgi:Protein of unknown function (DUF3038)
MMPASPPHLDDLLLPLPLDSSQLIKITTDLESIEIAIAALTRIDRIEIEQIAEDLEVASLVADWVNQWSLDRPVSHQQLDIQQIRALVLIINHIAHKYQNLVRQHVICWQQTIAADRLPLQSPALAEYINNFMTIDRVRLGTAATESLEVLTETALSLSIGLLFYSSPNGHQLLWAALLQRSRTAIVPSGSI